VSAESTAGCTILLVDDEEANLDLLEAFLRAEGYRSLIRTTDARRAIELFEEHDPDLVLLDLHMPHLDGYEVLRRLRGSIPEDDYRPVLVLTADVAPEARERALSGGARDFITKPFDAVEVLLRVRNLLETRILHRQQRDARSRAEALAEENARLADEAHAATLARDRMLSVVAHDLRNPLSVIAMNAEMTRELLPPDVDPYLADTLAAISHASDRMQRLVQDLLDVAQIERGAFPLDLADHDPLALVAEAERLLRPAAQARRIALAVRSEGSLPAVRADGARVLQVLGNLVGNALKFAPEEGRVEIGCSAGADSVEITVVDDGPGIPASALPNLFEAFWQVSEDDRRGVGLGLWIARSLVEAQGGRIRVESSEGVGTLFGFTLPHAPAAAEERAAGPGVPVGRIVGESVAAAPTGSVDPCPPDGAPGDSRGALAGTSTGTRPPRSDS
jgi:signal transduction histidine kinase